MQPLKAREAQIHETGANREFAMQCDKQSVAGSVSQRACVFCGSRVVLYPIADALHLVHGPIGCAAYTWDIRGSLSSGPRLYRLSFSTDLRELEVIYGGEKKLYHALKTLIAQHRPAAAFVYATCIAGLIGDDIAGVCKRVASEEGIAVLPVHSEGFKGTKKDGYRAACDALDVLIGTGSTAGIGSHSINILGEFNLAGEAWMIKEYYRNMGVDVVSIMTGDGRVADIQRAHGARLNVVQCTGSMTYLAKQMEKKYGIPYVQVSYFGFEDTAAALYTVADFFNDPAMQERARTLVNREITAVAPQLEMYRRSLAGRRAAIYVGGAFKLFSLFKALTLLGMRTVVAGSQTGSRQDYERFRTMCEPGTVLLDDTNPLELAKYVTEKGVDLLIGGVKERPIAYKLGIGFCDHNHERKIPLAGFEGMLHFAREVHSTVQSPIWGLARRVGKAARP